MPAPDPPQFRAIEQEVTAAEEALSLGAVVRPLDMPSDERWVTRLPEEDDEGRPLERWFAGRVERVDEEGVHLVFATTEPDPEARRVLRKVVPADVWRTCSNLPLRSAAGRFVEIGEHGGDLLIEPVPTYRTRVERIEDPELRYLRRWTPE